MVEMGKWRMTPLGPDGKPDPSKAAVEGWGGTVVGPVWASEPKMGHMRGLRVGKDLSGAERSPLRCRVDAEGRADPDGPLWVQGGAGYHYDLGRGENTLARKIAYLDHHLMNCTKVKNVTPDTVSLDVDRLLDARVELMRVGGNDNANP